MNEHGQFAYTDDGVAITGSEEEAEELKEWIAIDFLGEEDASRFEVVQLDVSPLDE